jgi:hypothetical protein
MNSLKWIGYGAGALFIVTYVWFQAKGAAQHCSYIDFITGQCQ